MTDETMFFEVTMLRETEKAILIEINGEEVWLPKSLVTFADSAEIGQLIEIELPLWLARKAGMI